MIVTVVIATLTLTQLVASQQKMCASCASPELRGRWQITGLPPVNNDYFKQCSQAGFATNSRETCLSGPCMTIVFQDPDRNENEADNLLFVRGCQQTLMQIRSSAASTLNETCEDDLTYPFTDSNGLPARRRMTVYYCNTDQCNDDPQMAATFCPTKNAQINPPVKGIIDCFECSGKGCKDKTCKGKKYCMKQSLAIGDVKEVQKRCSNVNIYGSGNICQQNEVISTPGGIAVKTQYEQCICDSDHCNTSSKILSIVVISTIIVVKYML